MYYNIKHVKYNIIDMCLLSETMETAIDVSTDIHVSCV